MSYAVRLQVFEGPLDLLLHLVEAQRLDIRHIPIADIVDQYLEYLDHLRAVDLEAASEFLVMAATLVEIKARMLLPRPVLAPEAEPDPGAELIERLVVYRQFKRAAAHLEELAAWQSRCFLRGGKVASLPAELAPVTVARLAACLAPLLERAAPVLEVARRRYSVRQKMREIMRQLRRYRSGLSFWRLLRPHASRDEVVVAFLALLELLRWGRVIARQEHPLAELLLWPREGIPGSEE